MADERSTVLAMLAARPDEGGGMEGGPTDLNRLDLEAEIRRATDPRIKAVLLRQYDQEFRGGAYPAAVASSMRDGFPELREGGASPAPPEARKAFHDPLDDFLARMNGDAIQKPQAHPVTRLDEFLRNFNTTPDPEPPKASVLDRVKDTGLGLLQGAIGLAQFPVGIADLATGGQVGKALENKDGDFGLRFDAASEYLQTLKSPALQAAMKRVSEAAKGQEGDDQRWISQIGRVGLEALKNPSVIADSIWNSLPSMAGGAIIGRAAIWGALSVAEKAAILALPKAEQAAAIVAASPRISGVAAGIGEGVVTMGSSAESIRTSEHNPSRDLDLTQSGLAAGAGIITGALGSIFGALSKKVGIETADNLMAGVRADAAKNPGMFKRLVGGAGMEFGSEGLQSTNEQIAQNLATDQPWNKDLAQQQVMGALSGGVMGAGAQLFRGRGAEPAAAPPSAPLIAPDALARSNAAMADMADATNIDDVVAAYERTHIPAAPPQGFDAENAMARLARANARDEATLLDRTGLTTPEVVGSAGALAEPLVSQNSPAADPATATVGETALDRITAVRDQTRAEAGMPSTAPATPVAKVSETFQERLANVREKLDDSRTRQLVRDNGDANALHDALYFAQQADNATLPGKTSDRMLAHVERILDMAGVQPLPAQVQAAQKAQTMAEKQAKIDAEAKQNEPAAPAYAPPGPLKASLDAAAAVPSMGLKERAAAFAGRQKAALLTGNATVNEEGLIEPLPNAQASMTPGEVDDLAHVAATSPKNELLEPTTAQKDAGNYQKGHIQIGALDISVENPQGSVRSGVSPGGKEWSNTLQHHYGYIRGTVGNDKDHVDAFIKPGTASDYAGPVFVVDQNHVGPGGERTSRFDEHKVLIGFADIDEAKAAYRTNYAKGWDGMQAISTMPMAQFSAWVKDGPKNAPLVPRATLKERVEALKERSPEPDKVASDATPKAQTTPQARAESAPSRDPELVELRKRASVLESMLECLG